MDDIDLDSIEFLQQMGYTIETAPPSYARRVPTVFVNQRHRSTPNRQRRNRQQRSHAGGGSSGDSDDGGDGPPSTIPDPFSPVVNPFNRAGANHGF